MPDRISFGQAIVSACRKWRVPAGRASRAEYWWFALFQILVAFSAVMIGGLIAGAIGFENIFEEFSTNIFNPVVLLGLAVVALVYLWFYVAYVSVSARRLHDLGLSAKPLVIVVVLDGFDLVYSVSPEILGQLGEILSWTAIGATFIVMVLALRRGNQGPNRFGPDPFAPVDTAAVFD